MNDYILKDPDTGQTVTLRGDTPPDAATVAQAFDKVANLQKAGSIGPYNPADNSANLPQPSIAERVAGNALFGGNEKNRRAYMLARGKNPAETGAGVDAQGNFSPRELAADVLETGVGPGLKLAGQIAGEGVGTTMGAVGGPMGAIAGNAVGGGVGTAVAQAGLEGAAGLTGLNNETISDSRQRILNQGIAGAATSLGGQLLGKGIKSIQGLPGARAIEDFMLTNVTQMPKGMQSWVRDRWLPIWEQTKEPLRSLADTADKYIIPTMKSIKADLGKAVGDLRQNVLGGAFQNKSYFTGMGDEIRSIAEDYAQNLSSKDVDLLSNLGIQLENKGYTAKAHDALIGIRQRLASQFSGMDIGSTQTMGAVDDMLSKVKTAIDTRLGITTHPDYQSYKTFMDLYDKFSSSVGSTPQQILNFLGTHLFNEDAYNNVYGRDMVNEMFQKYLGPTRLTDIKNSIAAQWMKSEKISTSGFKAGIPARIGAVAGEAIGGPEGGNSAANLIGATGLPYFSPKSTAWAHRQYERLAPYFLAGKDAVAAGTRAGIKLLTSPMAQAIDDIQQRHMVDSQQQ